MSQTHSVGMTILCVFGVMVLGFIFLALIGSAIHPNANPAATNTVLAIPAITVKPPEEPKLALQAQHATEGYGYVTIEGLVSNISNESMENVEAVVMVADEQGNFIASKDALIDYNPILPGQSSPFTVMLDDNPAIKKWQVSFKDLMGGEIPHIDNFKK